MEPEPLNDPRFRALAPTEEETAAWAEREHKRREGWLAGPSADEKEDWARRWRRRAAFGLEESRLAPTREDVEGWAEREHKRRAAWLAAPTEEEKREWMRSHGRRVRMGLAESDLPPGPEEADAWAERERRRRQEWLAGPSDEEKRDWAHRQVGGLGRGLADLPLMQAGFLPEVAEQFLREAELAGKGYLYALASAPGSVWSYLLRAGRSFEQEFYQPPGRRRVRY